VSRTNLTLTYPALASGPVRFAAEELRRYLTHMTGAAVALRPSDGPANTLRLGSAGLPPPGVCPDAESFVVQPSADGAIVCGGSPRALVHAVYALLEQLGCRWSLHGREHETVPRLARLPGLKAIRTSPRFRVRGYSADIMTWHYGDAAQFKEHLTADYEFIDWMGKSGGNTYLFIRHPFDSQLTIPELLPECARRGIDVEYGGHVIPLLLPRELFATHPEFFPQSADGVRSEFGNLCTSNTDALRTTTENAVHYVRDYPELRGLHVWGADLWQGGWCHCRLCRDVTVQDQSLRLCNAIAATIADRGAERPVCYLAYHDTVEPNLVGRPHRNVYVEYAPRERCYGHALNDDECPTNRRYRRALERYVELFEGRVRIFEYYADAILFCGCAVPLGDVIAADLDYYHRLGITEITNLQFGSFSLWAYPLNMLAYANATVGRCDVGALRQRYAQEFGAHARLIASTLGELETALRPVVIYGDIRRPPKQPERIRELHPRITGAIERLAQLSDQLAPASADAAVAALQALMRYTRAVLVGVERELAGGADAGAAYDEAMALMRAVDRRFTGLWGAVNLPVIHSFHSSGMFAA